jgi:hypothetical protein
MWNKASLGVSVFAISIAAASGSQANSLARLLSCSDIARAEERLQCYDAAARVAIGMGAAPEPRPAAAGDAEAAERDARIRALEAQIREMESAKTAAAKGSTVAPAALSEREQALAAREAELRDREAKLATVAKERDAVEEEATLFGIPIPFTKKDRFNQVENLDNQAVERNEHGMVEAIVVGIAEFSYSADEKLILVLQNGQVWRQTEGERINLRPNPKQPHTARIARGAVGSFNLQINDLNRIVKVRRIDGPQIKR